MIGYFIFNDKDSRDYDCYLEEMPSRTRPAMAYTEYKVDGMDGSKIVEKGYMAYDKILKLGITTTEHLDDLMGLRTGSGKLIFGDETDKYYNVQFLAQADYEKLKRFRKCNLQVHFQPFKYSTYDIAYTGTDSIKALNEGNIYSKPILTINGSGSCTVSVNGTEVCTVSELPITIDSKEMKSYYGTTNKNRKKTGDFLTLPVGQSTITLSGSGITGAEIKECSRWL